MKRSKAKYGKLFALGTQDKYGCEAAFIQISNVFLRVYKQNSVHNIGSLSSKEKERASGIQVVEDKQKPFPHSLDFHPFKVRLVKQKQAHGI